MNYSEMGDFEINKAVAIKLGWGISTDFQSLLNEYAPGCVNVAAGGGQSAFDPCNSWADAGPIIQSNGITVAFSDESWFADASAYWVDGVEWQIDGVIHENPLRAAMIVFLMMRETENDK